MKTEIPLAYEGGGNTKKTGAFPNLPQIITGWYIQEKKRAQQAAAAQPSLYETDIKTLAIHAKRQQEMFEAARAIVPRRRRIIKRETVTAAEPIPAGLRARRREDYFEAARAPVQVRMEAARELVYRGKVSKAVEAWTKQMKALQTRATKKAAVMEEQRYRQRYYEAKAPKEIKESIAFYTGLGYPTLAGRYAPFKVPPGLHVKALVPTKEGLAVMFAEEEAPPSLSEQIYRWKPPTLGLKQLFVKTPGAEAVAAQVAPTKEAHKFFAGALAPFEAFPYSISHLIGKKEWFGIKVPKPPPTVVGGFVGKGVEAVARPFGKELPSRELEETWERGPEYTLGTIFGDILMGYGIGKAAGWTWKKIRGVKAVKIAGVEEVEKVAVQKWTIAGERVTKIALEKTRVPAKYASWIQRAHKYFQPKQIALAGKEKVAIAAPSQVFVGGKAAEAVRAAGPYVAAIQKTAVKEPSIIKNILTKLHILKKPPPTIYKEAAAISTKLGRIQEPIKILSLRQFTGVQIFGKIDPSIYLRYAKAVPPAVAQQWYRQMGGVTVQQLAKVGAVTAATRVAAIEVPRTGLTKLFGVAPALARAVPTYKPAVTEAVVKRELWPTRKIQFERRELLKPTVKKPTLIEPERVRAVTRRIIVPTLKPTKKPAVSLPTVKPAKEAKAGFWFDVSKWKLPTLPSLAKQPFHIDVELPVYTPDVQDYTKEAEKLKTPQLPKPTEILKVTPRVTAKTAPTIRFKLPAPTPTRTPWAIPPYLPRGGRGMFARRFGRQYAAWYKRRHPIPTAKELAERFGFMKRRGKKTKLWR